MEERQPVVGEEEDVAEILCAAQMKDLLGEKSNTRMDGHLKDVRTQQKSLFKMRKAIPFKVDPLPKSTFTVSSSEKLLADIKQNFEELENKYSKTLRRSNFNIRNSFEIEEEKFYDGFLDDQRKAGDYFLNKFRNLAGDDQLLMLLHGQPGSGKTFFVERVRDHTNLRMKITASSGLAGMSLGGTTLDWLMGFGYTSNSTADLDTLTSRFKGVELLVIDEISMIGCRKLLKVDTLLKKVFNDTRPFGGLHILLVGDFAQLPAIKQTTIINAMVNSTKTHSEQSDLEMQVEALFGLFTKYELRGFKRSEDCRKLRKLLRKFRDYENTEPTLSENDLERIGILSKEVFRKDPEFRDATILVTTRRERDAINMRSGREWAKEHGVPVYWYFQRASRRTEDPLEADHYAHSMSKFCCGVRAFFIPGANCMLKVNTAPSAGYANGSQGRMIGVVHDDSNYVLPSGSPGEMIMIPPPSFFIMEVHHKVKGNVKRKTILPCKRQETKLEYYRNGKECCYRCWSNMVVLTFALTVHETQGQTLRRIILLLGRLPGMNVGKITWSLVYVALSRTKKLSHIKLFPTGSSKYYHSMYFAHLLKLSMPGNLKKWHRSYVDHRWDRNVLINEHIQHVREVEKRLKHLGPDKTKRLSWEELLSLVKKLGYKATTRDRKWMLYSKLKEHMVKRFHWKSSQDLDPIHHRSNRRGKRTAQRLEAESYQKSKSTVRPSKRLRKSKVLKDEFEKQSRRSKTNKLSRVPLSSKHRVKNSRGMKKKCLERSKDPGSQNVKRKRNSRSDIVNGPPITLRNQQSFVSKGLRNLGNTCYFNSIIQCLFHCPFFRAAVESLPTEALTVDFINHIQMLLKDMTSRDFLPYTTPMGCLTAALNIPECKTAGIVKGAQQDSSEFLGHLLEHFKQKFRPLSDMFEGKFVSIHKCQLCSYSYTKTQPFNQYTLQMDLPSTHGTQTFDLYN